MFKVALKLTTVKMNLLVPKYTQIFEIFGKCFAFLAPGFRRYFLDKVLGFIILYARNDRVQRFPT